MEEKWDKCLFLSPVFATLGNHDLLRQRPPLMASSSRTSLLHILPYTRISLDLKVGAETVT